MDAVHPTHAARSVGCWAPAGEPLAVRQTSGRERLNIHGALDLETGKTAMIEVESVDAASTIKLLEAIEAMYPLLAMVHVFLDNARYHHAVLVQQWLAQPGPRIRLHFIPTYPSPLVKPDVRISRIRLSDGLHARLTADEVRRVRRATPYSPKIAVGEYMRTPRPSRLARRLRNRWTRSQTCRSTAP